MSDHDTAFAFFVSARGPALLRLATLLCSGDRAAGEDLLQGALERVLLRWRRRQPEFPEAYVRRAIVTASLRRRGRSLQETVMAEPPERPARDDGATRLDVLVLRAALSELPPRQRAAVVLRHYEGLSEAECAELLSCSIGTVKSATSRGLARLRSSPALSIIEPTWS